VNKRLKQAAIVIVVVVAAAQLVRPERANPATDANRTIQAHTPTGSGLVAVLDRLAMSCEDATKGKTPGAYTLLRPETRLSPQDVETICAAARQADTRAAGGSR
jgi:hypothetical protein